MAVNGIEIAVGQKWRCRDGMVREIDSRDGHEPYPWNLCDGSSVTEDGHEVDGCTSMDSDLIELVSETAAQEEFVSPGETPAQPEPGDLNIEVGQVWKCRDGVHRAVSKAQDHPTHPWVLDNGAHISATGQVFPFWPNDPSDLMTLVTESDFPVLEFTPPTAEYTGASVSYYKVEIPKPTSGGAPYVAECNDIIEALGLNYAEGNVLKALWRRAAARQGKVKKGYTDGLYDAEKVVFFANRVLVQEGDK